MISLEGGESMRKWFIYLNLAIPFITKFFIPDGRYGALTIITDTAVLPSILLALNIVLFLGRMESSLLRCAIFMFLGLVLGNFVGYIVWGITNKSLLHPDAETVWIAKKLLVYHSFFVIVSFLVLQVTRVGVQAFRK